ncbi:MAG: DUF4105 domain-containing protein [Gemmatimonadota bacterium]
MVSRGHLDGYCHPGDLREIRLHEQAFDGREWIAHTFLVFEFDASHGDRRFIGLSMEARREIGEDYSIPRGMLRGFEAALVWATGEDLATRRVVYA